LSTPFHSQTASNAAHGIIRKYGDSLVLRFERYLHHPIEEVWAAITEPEQLATWLAEAEIELVQGGHVRLRWLNTDTVMNATITQLEPPQLLEYAGDRHGVLRWELRKVTGGCLLTFSSTLPASFDRVAESLAGWHTHLDFLAEALDGQAVDWPRWPLDRWTRHYGQYSQMDLRKEESMSRFVLMDESEEYRKQREELLAAEIALKDQIERVAVLRRQLPMGKRMGEYLFREGPADLSRNDSADMFDARLSDLFTDGHDTLLIDHMMFSSGPYGIAPCTMCSMWADGYNAIAPHVMQRASFVLVARAEIAELRSFAQRRGWNRIRLLSSANNTFDHDCTMGNADGTTKPGLSVFTRLPDGSVYHRYTICADFDEWTNRGIDLYSPVWQLFDLLPAGRGDWYPSHEYMSMEHKS
jgi:predicted dithiol-disulfide oxidoreductase (DUF899 family)/uncharacterized protein YndB with AHSA1/START domain